MEALIYLLCTIILMETAAIMALSNECNGRVKENKHLKERLTTALTSIINMGKTIEDLKDTIRELRKRKTNLN